MFDAVFCLFDGAAFDAEDDIQFYGLAYFDNFCPVDDALAAGAADGCAGYLAAFVF